MDSTTRNSIAQGFAGVQVSPHIRAEAEKNLLLWLSGDEFRDYWPQLLHLIQNAQWSYLLDSFYQTIPFGTG